MGALPTGTVTFLFTDIEGSTRLLEQSPGAFPEILDAHHRLLREAVSANGGVEISTEGDAFFVAFSTAPEAVRYARQTPR